MQPITDDIFQLWETVECEFPRKVQDSGPHYGSRKYTKFNGGAVVGQSILFQANLKYLVPKGILYPVVGSFRSLVRVDSDTGIYSWKKSLLAVWDELGVNLARIVMDKKEENPEYLGKSRNPWSNLFKEVLISTVEL